MVNLLIHHSNDSLRPISFANYYCVVSNKTTKRKWLHGCDVIVSLIHFTHSAETKVMRSHLRNEEIAAINHLIDLFVNTDDQL